MSIYIFGHKNPDTDSVASAIGFSYLKNQLGFDTLPCVLDNINKESQFVLDYFNLPKPILLDNVKVQVKDLKYDFVTGIPEDYSILTTYKLMEVNHFETVAVLDNNNKLLGIISMKDIAMGLIKGDFYYLNSSLSNLITGLDGTLLTGSSQHFEGRISVIALYYKTIVGSLNNQDIVIVGDIYDIIETAIHAKVQLIIVTGGKPVPEKYIEQAQTHKVTILSVPGDTYYVSKLINQCNYVSTIMRTKNIIKFNELDYLEEIKEEMMNTHFRNYPVTDQYNTFLGFINRKHIMNPARKKVILVDHNEYAQSAEGLDEAEILEVIDHHKIGDISTSIPISFRNSPVGSTCTMVYWMTKESGVALTREVAGILLSGIVSDTLLFRSPTTTEADRRAVKELNETLQLNLEAFAMDMFKAGTSLEGQSIEEIFYKDFKEFHLDIYKTGISQVFTLDIEDVFNRRDDFVEFIQSTHRRNHYDITLLIVTDILKEGSYLLFQSRYGNLVSLAFDVPAEQGVFVQGVVSRKKQVIPMLLDAIHLIK